MAIQSSKHHGDAGRAQAAQHPNKGKAALMLALLAETTGTFLLTFVAAGAGVIDAVSGGAVGAESRAVAPGLLVLALIYAIGNDSGAHFNPAVTFAFALRRAFPWRWLPGYWGAQLAGALCAAWLLLLLFGPVNDLGATHAHHGALVGLALEVLLTFLLSLVILGTSTRYSLIGPDAAMAVGATIVLNGLFAAPISDASMNPARSLGPALVSGALGDVWIYLFGPFIGSALAAGLTAVLHRHRHASEREAAQGAKLERDETTDADVDRSR